MSNTSVGEGGVFLFYCTYVFDKVCKQEIRVLEMSEVLFGISGTLCVVKFWLSSMVIRVKSI